MNNLHKNPNNIKFQNGNKDNHILIKNVNDNKINEKYIKDILKLKGFNYLEELINWIKQIKKYQNFVFKIKELYFPPDYNNCDNKFYNDILSWIKQNIDINKEIKKYENFCKDIMRSNNLDNIKEFKDFMNQILNKNRQNTEFLKDMKKIFLNNFIPKTVNENNFNDISY